MKNWAFLRASSLLLVSAALAFAQAKPLLYTKYVNLPLSFEANQGQTDAQVRYLSRGQGYSLFLTDSEAVLSLPQKGKAGDVVRMQLSGANQKPLVSGVDQLPGKSNYFIGNDPSKWRRDVPTYRRVRYKDVYPGVDLVYYGNQRQLEYDFVVAPGADPAAIRLVFNGAKRLRIDDKADLSIGIANGELSMHAPMIYQEIDGRHVQVSGAFAILSKDTVGFHLGEYDHASRLVIDPTLAYSTFLAGLDQTNSVRGIAVDEAGNAYVTGDTGSSYFPTTPGAFQASPPYPSNAFVTKINADGTNVIYSTYLGGGAEDFGVSIAVDSSGDAFIAGYTQSSDFPVTGGAFQTTFPAGGGTFVSKLNAAGSSLIYSTFFGNVGSGAQGPQMTIDSAGNAYVAGSSNSTFPVTPGSFQTSPGSTIFFNAPSVIAKLDPTGSHLLYGTFFNGTKPNASAFVVTSIYAIAVDSNDEVFVAGATDALDLPVTAGAFQSTPGSGFVARLNAAGSGLIYLSYFAAGPVGIAIDSSDSAYLTGFGACGANGVPTTPGAFETSGGFSFVTKVKPDGSGLVYSSCLGSIVAGQGALYSFAIAVDAAGEAYVTGETGGPGTLPVTADALQPQNSGAATNAFLTKFNASGSGLIYSTYFGGGGGDLGNAIALDPSGNAYIGGFTQSTKFPVTFGAYDSTFYGPEAAFVSKFGFATAPSTDQVTVGTSPNGLSFSVDGALYTTQQILALDTGSTHTIATTSPQGSAGTQYTFSNWSDGGAESHNITVNAAATYAANFSTSYLLTTGAVPAGGGVVSPASGAYFTAGANVSLTATPASGYAFSGWSGAVANPNSASTTITMNSPETVTASFIPSGAAALFGNITGKSGATSARVWSVQVSNNGPAAAVASQIDSISFIQAGGAACAPTLSSLLPVTAGTLAPGASATVPVTLNFNGCAANSRFTVTVSLSANSGTASGSIVRLNQFQ